MEQGVPATHGAGTAGHPHAKKKKKGNPGKDLVPLYKMNSKQITDLM